MRATRNTIRLRRTVDPSSVWQEVKAWARGNVTNDKIARNALALAGAVSMCYVAARLVQGVQSWVAYAY
jgi:hypothetical protein